MRRTSSQGKPSVKTEEVEPDSVCQEENEKICTGTVEMLKSTVVNESNMDLIKSNLKLTSQYRLKMLHDKSIDLLESFPYFFVDPKLVRAEPIKQSISQFFYCQLHSTKGYKQFHPISIPGSFWFWINVQKHKLDGFSRHLGWIGWTFTKCLWKSIWRPFVHYDVVYRNWKSSDSFEINAVQVNGQK